MFQRQGEALAAEYAVVYSLDIEEKVVLGLGGFGRGAQRPPDDSER